MKKSNIHPRGKQVLVQPDSKESRENEHGLITPSNVEQEQKSIGKVIAVGPEIKDIKKGDRVIYGTYAGDDLSIEDNDYKLLNEEFVLAFIKE